MNKVWDEWVSAGPHARSGATGEAKLATPQYKVEMITIPPRSDVTSLARHLQRWRNDTDASASRHSA